LWFGGFVASILTVIVTRNDPWWLLLVCASTLYPALFLWFSVGAFEGLWRLYLRPPWAKGPSSAGQWAGSRPQEWPS
jgi:hypothetical protein